MISALECMQCMRVDVCYIRKGENSHLSWLHVMYHQVQELQLSSFACCFTPPQASSPHLRLEIFIHTTMTTAEAAGGCVPPP